MSKEEFAKYKADEDTNSSRGPKKKDELKDSAYFKVALQAISSPDNFKALEHQFLVK